jgi:hypothetical protein
MKAIAIKFFRWNYKGTTYTFRENEEIKNICDTEIQEIIKSGYAKYFEPNKELPIENKRAEIENKKEVFTKLKKNISLVTKNKPKRRGRPPKKDKRK